MFEILNRKVSKLKFEFESKLSEDKKIQICGVKYRVAITIGVKLIEVV